MGLRFGFLFTVLNSGDYLWYSLANAYRICVKYPGSRIIVVEGAGKFVDQSIVTPEGYSRDGTSDLAVNFNDPWNIITYLPIGNVEDRPTLRRRGLSLLKDVDYIVVKSHRELFCYNDFCRIAEDISKASPQAVLVQPAMLYSSFKWMWKLSLKSKRRVIFKNNGGIPKESSLKDVLSTDTKLWSYSQIGTSLSQYKRLVYGVARVNYEHRTELFYHRKRVPSYEEYKRDWLEGCREPDSDSLVRIHREDHPKIIHDHPWATLSPWEIFTWKTKLPTFVGEESWLKDIC